MAAGVDGIVEAGGAHGLVDDAGVFIIVDALHEGGAVGSLVHARAVDGDDERLHAQRAGKVPQGLKAPAAVEGERNAARGAGAQGAHVDPGKFPVRAQQRIVHVKGDEANVQIPSPNPAPER